MCFSEEGWISSAQPCSLSATEAPLQPAVAVKGLGSQAWSRKRHTEWKPCPSPGLSFSSCKMRELEELVSQGPSSSSILGYLAERSWSSDGQRAHPFPGLSSQPFFDAFTQQSRGYLSVEPSFPVSFKHIRAIKIIVSLPQKGNP